MKKLLISVLIFFACTNAVFSADSGLSRVDTKKLNYTPKLDKETKDLAISEEEAMQGIASLQQQKDFEDLDMLWKATIENNNIIKFAMKKLSVSPDQQRYHSSILAKSVSALVNGASFVPSLFGANYMVQSASYATGRLANNYISKINNPKEVPLTDTELIELAGMIESLQDQIINSYYSYKMTLNQIKDTRQQLVLYNKNYANALKTKNQMEIIISGAQYDDLMFEELELTKQARKYQIDLERLAGKKTVAELNLSQYNFKDELFSQKILNSPKEQSNEQIKMPSKIQNKESVNVSNKKSKGAKK